MKEKKEDYREIYRGIHLKIEHKRLPSGRIQVRFRTYERGEEDLYGYAIVHPEKCLKALVREIQRKIQHVHRVGDYYQRNLYAIRKREPVCDSFLIFRPGKRQSG